MLLGIDSGQTALKTVVFDDDGHELGAAARATVPLLPRPGWAERDPVLLSEQLFETIAESLQVAGVSGHHISAVGIAGHGDGLYLLGPDGRPSRHAVLSYDTRAAGLLDRMRDAGDVARAVVDTGQEIFAGSAAPLARWLIDHEPETLARTAWLLSCKDWLRFCLTGDIATDPTDGNACLGTIDGRGYSASAIAHYGLSRVAHMLPPMRESAEVAGEILPTVAERTGLRPGIAVVVGAHDVVAAVLGLGAGSTGAASAIAGTFGMNQVVSAERVLGDRLQSRPWVEPGRWVVMAGSPASAANFGWFLRTLMAEVDDPIAVANTEVAAALADDSELLFHPFLYGGPNDQSAGNLLGLQGRHTRGHIVRAIWEGVVFTHGSHLDELAPGGWNRIRLGGGAARSPVWSQMFADGLGCTVEVGATTEPGALGAAMLAAVGTGIHHGFDEATARCVRVAARYVANDADRQRWRAARRRFNASLSFPGR